MEELVSVIIPACQEEKRIERCLSSIAASTYRKLELIVVNDGSTDNTENIVKRFKEKNESGMISVEIITVANGGSGRARNRGIEKAKGKYIGFADADDMIHPEMIEKLVKSLRKGYDMASCGLLLCDENGKKKPCQYHFCGQKISCPGQALKTAMWEQIQMSLCTVLFRREKIIDKEGKLLVSCPEHTAAFEDFAFVCSYLSRCSGIWEILPFRGYFYCKQEKKLSSRIWSAEELCFALQPILAVGEKMEDDFTSHKLQYTFRFMAFWYEEAFRCSRRDFCPGSVNWKICMQELERYADIYMKDSRVTPVRKLAVWIVRRHPGTGRLLAKTVGRLVF